MWFIGPHSHMQIGHSYLCSIVLMLEQQIGYNTDPGFWSWAVQYFLLPLVLEAGSHFVQDSLNIQP